MASRIVILSKVVPKHAVSSDFAKGAVK